MKANMPKKIMACTEVTRWHAVGTTRQQTLAEHQWVVAMLAREIGTRADMELYELSSILDMALIHDIDEVDGGDPPNFSPPEDIIEIINKLDNIRKCIKFADLIDAAYFAKHWGAGVRGRRAARETLERLDVAIAKTNNRFVAGAALATWNDING